MCLFSPSHTLHSDLAPHVVVYYIRDTVPTIVRIQSSVQRAFRKFTIRPRYLLEGACHKIRHRMCHNCAFGQEATTVGAIHRDGCPHLISHAMCVCVARMAVFPAPANLLLEGESEGIIHFARGRLDAGLETHLLRWHCRGEQRAHSILCVDTAC